VRVNRTAGLNTVKGARRWCECGLGARHDNVGIGPKAAGTEYGCHVILAEFEVFHSRPVAPTRRVAISGGNLPVERTPGFGGLLLAGIVGAHVHILDDEARDDIDILVAKVAAGDRVAQPQLRHRLQVDRIGLTSSVHRLRGDDETLRFDFAADAPPAPQILAAIYRTGRFDAVTRRSVMTLLKSAVRWTGPSADLMDWLTGLDGSETYALPHADPIGWALDVFGLDENDVSKREVQRRFRRLLRAVHPDHGGRDIEAGDAIGRITEARRILLAAAC